MSVFLNDLTFTMFGNRVNFKFFFIKAQFIFNVSVGLKLMNSRSLDDAQVNQATPKDNQFVEDNRCTIMGNFII